MDSRVIDNIVESLVSGNMGVDDFMQAVQDNIEAREAAQPVPYDPASRTGEPPMA